MLYRLEEDADSAVRRVLFFDICIDLQQIQKKSTHFRSKIVRAISNLFDDKEIEFDRELYLFAFKNRQNLAIKKYVGLLIVVCTLKL